MGISTADYRTLCRNLKLNPIAGLRDAPAPKEKYGRRKKELDGIIFDSTAEAKAYVQLKALQVNGEIWNLQLQPSYVLQEAFRDESGKHHRKIVYRADFTFLRRFPDHTCRQITADVKGFQTPTFRIKEKLFRAKYPHITLEIWKPDVAR